MGPLVHVDLPEVGDELSSREVVSYSHGLGSCVESAKAVADVFNPLDGEVVEVNNALENDATAINHDAEGLGWIMKIKIEYPW